MGLVAPGGPMPRSRTRNRAAAPALATLALVACLLPGLVPGAAAAADDGTCVGKGEYKKIHGGMSIQKLGDDPARTDAVRRHRRQGQQAHPLVRRLRGVAARQGRGGDLPPAGRRAAYGHQEGARPSIASAVSRRSSGGRSRPSETSATGQRSWFRVRRWRAWLDHDRQDLGAGRRSRAACARTGRCVDRPW